MLVDWPLIGRRSELAQIADLLAREDVRGIVLAGTSGVGKTRLADECLRIAVDAGFATARIHATRSAASIPLGVLAPLLPSVRSAGITDLLAEAREVLERAAAGRPFLLVVDDAHLLDEASATLIHQVAIGAGVFVVATVRTGEPVPDAIVALWKDGHAERIDLSPLDAAACDQLVTTVVGGSVDGGSLQALWRASEGNPLVLRELLIGAQEGERLESVGGVWRLRGAPAPSARLLELIQARLGGLEPTQRQALELIALGEPVPVAVLEACVGLTALAALEESGLIRVSETRNRADVTLVHPLHGEVLRDAMPPLRGRMLRRQLADTTEATGARRREDLMRVAMWRIESGSPGDPAVLTSAAREALLVDDNVAARRLATAAYEAGGGPEAGLLLGEVLCEVGQREDGDRILAEASAAAAVATADELPDGDRVRSQLAITRSDNLFWGLGRHDEAMEVVRAAECTVVDEGSLAQLAAQRASFVLMLGRVDEAVSIVMPLLESSTGRAFIEASVVAEPTLVYAGRALEAVAIAEKGFPAHLELGELMSAHPGIHIVGQALALNMAGRVREAESLAQFGYDAAAGIRRSAGQAWFGMILGLTALLEGRLATSAKRFREGASIFGELRHHGERWCLGGLAIATGMAGDPNASAAAVAEIDKVPTTPVLLSEPESLRGKAWAAYAGGHLVDSRRFLADAAALARDTGQRPLELAALHDMARIGHPADVVDRMAELTPTVDGELSALRLDHVRGLIAEDGELLERTAAAFEELGLQLFAAEAFADATAAFSRRSERRRADNASVRSRSAAARCEGARTPSLVHATTTVPLTRRELEIATLASQGHASKAIAERLFLSSRTVDNHLQRVYVKLGVTKRDELAGALAGYEGGASEN